MPNDHIWGPYKDLVYSETFGYVYGAEYEEPKVLFGMPNYAEDVPCAVCLSKQHTAYLMIPGRTQCYPGWTEVYQGDLAWQPHSTSVLMGTPRQCPGEIPMMGTGDCSMVSKPSVGPCLVLRMKMGYFSRVLSV
ncbi:hypothetical protein KP79_PYT19766 [Mizuhopecten yessoensis]|uniref:Uncharacterized protein n=1 Tax=Mizuhopecten yessoensis TaxID=6573 RepID=A0A210QZX5_MIZYE|nr:hypothetical protein KP79_PYT19766 [Mizuhopecten yessoensis]